MPLSEAQQQRMAQTRQDLVAMLLFLFFAMNTFPLTPLLLPATLKVDVRQLRCCLQCPARQSPSQLNADLCACRVPRPDEQYIPEKWLVPSSLSHRRVEAMRTLERRRKALPATET